MDKQELMRLAEEFGLPCIERENSITVIGLVQLIEFKKEFDYVKLEEIIHD